jgi:hypothetical protein
MNQASIAALWMEKWKSCARARARSILLGEMKYRLNEHVRLFVRRSSG